MKIRSFLFASLLATTSLFAQTFTDVAVANGITHSYGFGELGGGLSFADFNGDGWDDLTITSQDGDPLYFYINVGGSFVQITAPVTNTEETKEVIWVDYDNDGDKDLYLTVYEGPNRLYRNNGGLNMTDVTAAAFGGLDNYPSLGAVWGDVDRDGWLDLYLTSFVYESGSATNYLYMNDGDGTFTDVTSQSPTDDGVQPTFDGVFIDYNNDGWPDLYTTNDKYDNPNGLYRNDQGSFTDVTATSGAGLAINSMNAGGSDYDDDGDLDLYLSNTVEGNVLLNNNGDGTFSDGTAAAGVGFYRVGWASTFFDYDNDTDKDLYVSAASGNQIGNPNAMYVNQGNGTFTEPLLNSGGLGGSDYGESYSHAIGDIDNDGRLDIALNQFLISPFLLWHNQEPNAGNWVKVNLFGLSSNADGVGSMITLWSGGKRQIQYTHCSKGYLGQHSNNYHFGLGNSNTVDSLIIQWPSGVTDKLTNISNINRVVSVTEGDFSLPLTLLGFSLEAARSGALLKWQTTDEINVSHFEIEYSEDGRHFRYLDRVAAQGQQLEQNEYEHFQQQLSAATTHFFRLKMVDLDGSFEYSPIRSIRKEGEVEDWFSIIRLPNNPVENQEIQVGVQSYQAAPMTLSFYSRNGQLINSQQYQLSIGEQDLNLSIGTQIAGAYILRAEVEGLMKSFQLIVR